jgi:two-component system cell cycle sensor histidine kinase/response regulator CckA
MADQNREENRGATGRDRGEQFRAMLAAMAAGVVCQDSSGRIVYCNPAAERILGLPAEQIMGTTPADPLWRSVREDGSVFPPQEHPAQVTLRTGRPSRDVVMGLPRPDGTVTWISVDSEPVPGSGESLSETVVTTFCDVTRQRRSELMLKHREMMYRNLVENQGEGIGIMDLEERFVFANPTGEAIFGVPQRTLAGRSLLDFISEESAALIRLQTQARVNGERSEYELEIVRESDGAVRTLLISATPQTDESGKVLASFGVFRDITDRKRVENALQESEERLRLATEANRLGTFDIYPQIGKRVWSPLTKQLFGFAMDAEVSFEDFINAVHPEDRERVRREVLGLLSPGQGDKSFSEFRTANRADGRPRWMASWGRTFFDEQGRPLRLIGITQDITERKLAEQALRESEARLRLTFDQAPVGAAMVGLDHRFMRINDAFCRFLGYEARELIGRPGEEVTDPEDRSADTGIASDLESGTLDLYQADRRYIRKDGTVVWGHATVRLLRDHDGRALYFMCMVEDITERKRAEEESEKLQIQLLHAQKMESIGRLAGGVAHDFNNLLTVINGYSSLALRRLGTHDPLAEIIREIYNAGEAAAILVQQLLAFGRKQLLRKEPVDVNAMISGMEKTLLPLLGEPVEIRTALHPSLSQVVADPHQLKQVIINLAVNARDAMPGGGILTIETNEVTCGPYCRRCISPIGAGRYVCITVRDNGVGMDEQTRQHLFEPFFSTKAAGHGTGLGLAMVHGIVFQSGGHIDVESHPGKGTSFYIQLPAVENTGSATAAPETAARPETRAQGNETILLVEDQPEVRRLTASLLQECGYGVVEAGSAEEALSKIDLQRVDLILTDVMLPKMSGYELATQVRSRQPGAKVLFMSGYSDEMLKGQAGGIAGSMLIQKPFTPAEMAEKLRQLLGGGAPD